MTEARGGKNQRQGPPPDPADRGPGAHSGHESQARERVVPGTFSAAEGYSPGPGGTRQGDPLAGVELHPDRKADDAATDEGPDRPSEQR